MYLVSPKKIQVKRVNHLHKALPMGAPKKTSRMHLKAPLSSSFPSMRLVYDWTVPLSWWLNQAIRMWMKNGVHLHPSFVVKVKKWFETPKKNMTSDWRKIRLCPLKTRKKKHGTTVLEEPPASLVAESLRTQKTLENPWAHHPIQRGTCPGSRSASVVLQSSLSIPTNVSPPRRWKRGVSAVDHGTLELLTAAVFKGPTGSQ